ncbi:DoxX family protein [Saxibacter everestensis]|uniref:DoxX family protein n=1 Tax=Saxibacter everestensis TaxID=2909229 RepID=A0ABY8QT38_9MICO|nr:DoxX family protein [Brevibacteriaceae bacterium ZFBP1038]
MPVVADPVWPVIVLAIIQLGDAVMCIRPVAFIRDCLDDVGFARKWWWLLPPIKVAAAAGLIAGIWIPGLGLLTGCALILYFVIAILMHVRARDFGRNLFLNATGMLLLCVAVTVFSFIG